MGSVDFSRLFEPRAIAIVGASAEPNRIGGQPVRALKEFGYQGGVYPVNPKHAEIMGLACFADVAQVPRPCDVALICVPASAAPAAIRQCGSAGIAFAIVLSAGFREIGEKGMALQAELDAAIRDSGVRVIGPNCQGMMAPKNGLYCGFGAPFTYRHDRVGRVAMVTQSGGFGFAVMGLSEADGIGFNRVVSTGNEADVGALELIGELLDADDTDVVAAYLEGVRDGRRLIDLGRRALEANKPILVWKVGNSDTGRRAAASHTANLSAGYELYRAAFREGGYLEVDDVADLVDLGRAFGARRLPAGNQVAVISISGGAGVLLADRCEELGLALPPLSEHTLAGLREVLPGFGSMLNPIDVTAQVFNDFGIFNNVVGLVARDAAVHQLIVVTASVEGAAAERLARELAAIAATTDKPILVASSAPPARAEAARKLLDEAGIPTYPTPGRAAKGAAGLAEFAARRRRLARGAPQPRLTARQDLLLNGARGTLGEHRSKQLLTAYGIPVVREVLIGVDEVGALRQAPFPFPLVVKLDSPDLPHKTEAGAVRIDVRSLDEMKSAVREMRQAALAYRPGARIDGVTIQEMARGLEVIAGTTRDEFFGPTVVFGLGGVFTEVLRDVSHRFAPFDAATAREMILEIRSAQLLRGYRGKPGLDIEALADALSRLSLLAADHADVIAEIDVNPLFVRPAGEGVVAADALVVMR